jgi:hypothetical protein
VLLVFSPHFFLFFFNWCPTALQISLRETRCAVPLIPRMPIPPIPITSRYERHKEIHRFFIASLKYDMADRFVRTGIFEKLAMKKRAAILFFSCLSFASANPLSLTPVGRFIADRDFCAYMVSLPEHDAEEFLKRFQAAMSSATSFIRHEDQYLTEAQAIFSVKKKCDEALASLLHYK